MDREVDHGYTLPTPRSWVSRENNWRAARYGLEAEIIVDERGTPRPLRDAIVDLVDDLMPVARRLACADELAGGRPHPGGRSELPTPARRPCGVRR